MIRRSYRWAAAARLTSYLAFLAAVPAHGVGAEAPARSAEATAAAGRTFEPFHSEDGIRIEISRDGDEIPWIRATTEIDAGAKRLAEILSHYSRYGEIFAECFAKATVLESKDKTARMHIVWSYPILVRNRDAIPRYRLVERAKGTYALSWRDEPQPGDPSEGVRMRMEGEVNLEPLGPSRTRVVYTYLGDVGGDFSESIKKAAWKTQPVHYFRALRQELGRK